jgi:predicted outer membrane protein
MNTINRRAILAVALLFACGATAAATPPASHAAVHSVTTASSLDLPCNPLVCSVKGP